MTVAAFPIKSTGLRSRAIDRDATVVAWLALSRQETRLPPSGRSRMDRHLSRRGPRQDRGARAPVAGHFPSFRHIDLFKAVKIFESSIAGVTLSPGE